MTLLRVTSFAMERLCLFMMKTRTITMMGNAIIIIFIYLFIFSEWKMMIVGHVEVIQHHDYLYSPYIHRRSWDTWLLLPVHHR